MAEVKILITSFINPDIDGLACTIAYSEFLNATGRPSVYKVFGRPLAEAQFVIDFLQFKPESSDDDATEFQKIILVDSALTQGLDPSIELEKVTEVIDHRKVNDTHLFIHAKIQNELVGSCATLIAEKFQKENITPTRPTTIFLYSAIASNTLNFQANVTSVRDKAMARWLKKLSDLPEDYIHLMFAAKSDLSGEKLIDAIVDDYVIRPFAGKIVGIGQIEMIGSEALLANRKTEICDKLNKLGKEKNADINFLSIIDIEKSYNLFLANDQSSRGLLEKTLDIKFDGDIAKRKGLIMRKEIAPLIKSVLEK